jgi:DNA-binding phage protein
MPLTRDSKATIKARAEQDSAFRKALLTEALDSFLAGDMETCKALLRAYINATMGFEALGRLTGKDAKSLMRMFGPHGNPYARNLCAVLAHLQTHAGVHFHVHPARVTVARG